ncbi:MAG: 1-acyl-sn-glycerol-3-phosphate acyltransferase [Chloroflexota bacterium]|nr:1-acyl-sn-glycerol-3-phosphate acyltransferase [Chloroflexota bacterium]
MAQTLPRFYYFANQMLRHVVLPLAHVQVTVSGEEHVPREGALIIAGNHLSFLDPPLIGAFLPRDITFMSKAENFEGNRLSTWVVRNYGAFPVRRGEGDIGAIRRALQVLKEEGVLFIAPEGTRSDGSLGEPREGIALIAHRSGVPILPLGISGVEDFTTRVTRWRPTRVCLSIGQPFRLVSPTPKPDRATLQAMSEAVMERIAAQLPPAYRGRFQQFTENQQFVVEREA